MFFMNNITNLKTPFKSVILVSIFCILTASAAINPYEPKSNQFWWPDELDLSPLRQNNPKSNPLDKDFDYAKEFESLDMNTLKKDINTLLTDSQEWWPADYGNYGPFFIRMAWHAAGTYRTIDGRGGAGGGQQRFNPLNSWPDNANLDKARRLLWPIKQKYGNKISWADLIVLTGNISLENMGFKTLGFAGGRTDDWEPDLVYWGPETKLLSNDKRFTKDGKLMKPLGASVMGLIYVNPEGPNSNSDPVSAADKIRQTFGRMAMDDEETVALIAGGHAFGKAHGAVSSEKCVGPEPAAAAVQEQGLGWHNKCGKGKAEDTYTSGLEGAWTPTPTKWSTAYLDQLFKFDWIKEVTADGKTQWKPSAESAKKLVPDAHVAGKTHAPMMLTTDLSLKEDPEYRKIALRFRDNPEEFEKAFARAWFKLIHRDMGPKARYLGSNFPDKDFKWQDPLPTADYGMIDLQNIKYLKKQILASGLTVPELVRTAWASASTYRATDMRGGANGARIRLEPQKSWEVNNPKELDKVITKLQKIRKDFNKVQEDSRRVSLADLIVLGGAAAIEKASADAGYEVTVPFKPGRTNATPEQTDIESFSTLEPKADAFRNYYSPENENSPTFMMIDKANLLSLSVPEMTVLLGGMRALDANYDKTNYGVLTKTPGTLTNDFFVNLLDMSTKWEKAKDKEGIYQGLDRKTGELKWTATPVDLIFGSNSELRAIAEVYAYEGSKKKFVDDFVKTWTKVMNLDRF
jgi:catalase-peroxidase